MKSHEIGKLTEFKKEVIYKMRIKLKMERIGNELTQEELASMLEMAQSYYSRIESGKINPSYSATVKLQEIFPNVNVIELLENKG